MSEKWLGYGAAFTATTIFGLTFLFSKIALSLVTPVHLVALRFLCAALLLWTLAAIGVISVDLKGKPWGRLVRLALFQPVAYFTFETYGLFYGTSSEAGLFVALIPVLTAVLAAFFLRESISAKQRLFLLLSVVGAVFIVLMDGLVLGAGYLSKVFFLLAVVVASVFTVESRRQSTVFTPWEITFVMSMVGAVVFNSWAVGESIFRGELGDYFAPLGNMPFLLSLLFLAGAASVFGFFCTNFALQKIAASQYAVFNNYSTVVSILAGVLFLREEMQWYQWLGGGFIILGVWGTNYFRQEKGES